MPANRTVNKKEFIEQCQQPILPMPERTKTVLKFVATFDIVVFDFFFYFRLQSK